MAIQNRRGNIADFDPFKMLSGEFGYVLDTEELYYCVAPGNVKRVATKEDIVQILDTNQEAYDGLQQLLIELENETVASGILNDISALLDDVAINKIHIADNRTDIDTNTQDIINLDTKTMSHLAESANKHITESGSNPQGKYVKFDDGTMICDYSTSTYMTIGADSISSNTLSFPATFAARPSVTIVPMYDTTGGILVGTVRNVNQTSVNFTLYNGHPTASLMLGVQMIAVGRWK